MRRLHGNGTGDTTRRAETVQHASRERSELAIQWIVDSALVGFEPLRAARLRVGRGEDCELHLEHPSVSRLHAELYRQGLVYSLRDFESTNGTFLNGSRVGHATISAGDVLRCGDCIGVVVDVAPGAGPLEFALLAPELWGGPSLAATLAKAKTAARSDVPIVVVGETGSGKERIARALHYWSGRAGPFRAVNCATIPTTLAEAELFGHQRGAFTGAERARAGHFQSAHGGTLFLDEIAELPLEVQAKLLRAVEMGDVIPLGATAGTEVDVRIVATTHEPLAQLVEKKRFREDLAARLAGFVVEAPPLRERPEEAIGLFLHFLGKHRAGPAPRVAPALVEWLCLRDWPGNVRELELVARKLLALHADEPVLSLAHAEALEGTPVRSRALRGPASGSNVQQGFRDRREHDLHRLKLALAQTNGNMSAAAESIGISRRRAYRLLDAEDPASRPARS
jgi:transcriptional regulator of acetoin/glycerol metabolism